MSKLTPTKRKHGNERDTDIILTEVNLKSYNFKISNVKFLPSKCLQNVFLHCNSIYVGSEVRFWESQKHYGHNSGKVGQVHFVCQAGLYMSFFETKICQFQKVNPSDRWYVNQRSVMAGAMLCLTRPGSDDILMDSPQKTKGKPKGNILLLSLMIYISGIPQFVCNRHMNARNLRNHVGAL